VFFAGSSKASNARRDTRDTVGDKLRGHTQSAQVRPVLGFRLSSKTEHSVYWVLCTLLILKRYLECCWYGKDCPWLCFRPYTYQQLYFRLHSWHLAGLHLWQLVNTQHTMYTANWCCFKI
jgi:hypothetical protein